MHSAGAVRPRVALIALMFDVGCCCWFLGMGCCFGILFVDVVDVVETGRLL